MGETTVKQILRTFVCMGGALGLGASLSAIQPAKTPQPKPKTLAAVQKQYVDPKEMDLLERKHGFLKQKNETLANELKRFQAREIAVINALHEMTHAKDQKCPEDIKKLLRLFLDKE